MNSLEAKISDLIDKFIIEAGGNVQVKEIILNPINATRTSINEAGLELHQRVTTIELRLKI